MALIECVSYRANLQFIPCRSALHRGSTLPSIDELDRPEYIKKMRCLKQMGLLDPRCTLLQIPVVAQIQLSARFTRAFRWLGFVSACVSVFYDVYLQPRIDPQVHIPVAQMLAAALTTVYCGTLTRHYQRKLLVEILKSFDFAFFSAHITILHLCRADFFHWREDCVTLLITWLWFHWALCLDALTPIVRLKIGFHVRHVAPFFLIGIIAPACTTVHLMATSTTSSSEINDRVLFEWEILTTLVRVRVRVRVRVLPIFYNCVTTAFALALHFAWRLCTYASDDLLFIDGEVVYNNYFRRARNRKSQRRSGSVSCIPTTAVLQGDSVGSELSMTESKW